MFLYFRKVKQRAEWQNSVMSKWVTLRQFSEEQLKEFAFKKKELKEMALF